MKKTSVAIVDDHVLFRRGLRALLEEFEDIEVAFEAGNGQELLDQLNDHTVEVILLDLDMPVMNGYDAVKVLKESFPDIRIVIISMHHEDNIIEALIHAGAHGFLIKNQDIEVVIDCLRTIQETGFYFNPDIKDKQVQKFISIDQLLINLQFAHFTERETQVIGLICGLHTNKQIAEVLGISVRTVDGYIEKIFRKTGLNNRAGIVMYAIQNNMIKSTKKPEE